MTGAALLAVLLSCSGPGDSETATAQLEGYRSEAATHKLQVSKADAAALLQRGGRLIADYGAFQLLEVDSAALSSIQPGPSVRLQDEYNVIRLNAGHIDTASAHGLSLRGMTVPASGKLFHLVQFAGPIKPEWHAALQATGVQIAEYIPSNTYLVYGDAKAFDNLRTFVASERAVQWNGDYLNDYKLDPTALTAKTGGFSIQLIKDAEANAVTLGLIDQLKGMDGVVQEALGYVNVVAFLPESALAQIVSRPDVVSVQPYFEPTQRDERQNMIISGHLTGGSPTGPGYMAWLQSKGFDQAQFTASGFGVDVSDSGIDNGTPTPNHFGLYVHGDVLGVSRVVYNRLEGTPHSGGTIQGCDGHGNINAHIVGGYVGAVTGDPWADAEGYLHGLGVAPWVKVGSSVVFDPGSWTSPDYEDLQSRAYRDGMRLSTNSWGAGTNVYTTDCQRYDALVRDAQPTGAAVEAPGNQEMVIVFAAGNSGSSANTVGSPGSAKNVITSGASEHSRLFGGADGCGVQDSAADSAMDVAFFSSRGPSADGRKKPDFMAPGTHVGGGVFQADGQRANPPANPNGQAASCFDASGVCGGSGSNFFPSSQQWYTASSGTSHSTPATAGAAALVRQWFINQAMNPASPAMTKAFLMSTTRYMTGSGANDNLFSNNQGMGLMDLGMAFDGTQRMLRDQDPADMFTATGETRTFDGFISDPSKPLRITLAWTDAPGSTTGGAWKNDLDLTVTVGGNTYLGNVFTGASSTTGGAADTRNNVESVFLPAGVTGAFTVTITATNINSDGVPGNGSALDQDFALVVYNACTDAPPPVDGVAASVPGDNQIDITWTPNSAGSYTIYRSFVSGGPYTRIAEVAAPPYQDIGVSGGTTYYYVVRGKDCAESPNSAEVSATATGVCTLPPMFAGLTSATNGAATTCTNDLTWDAATPICTGSISYSVYRSTTPGFTPSNANRIATGVTGTTFSDTLNLAHGTPYYYVVRAVETTTVSNEDTNTVERAAMPTGAVTVDTDYFDDFDGTRPPSADAYWIPNNAALQMTSGCHYQSPTSSYRFGASGSTACGGTYPNSANVLLVLGGDGTVDPAINGFAISATPFNATMTFNLWYNFENRYDGAWLVYSTTGASGTYTQVPDSATPGQPYITTGGYDNTLTNGVRGWTNTNTGADGALKAVSVDISALAGQTVWFGLQFRSDSSVVREGLYLDDVRVRADSAEACSTFTPPPGPAASYRIDNLVATIGAGVPTTFDVTALDAFGLVADSYNGTASFGSSDAQALLPANATFVNGVATGVQIEMRTLGDQTVTATDVADPAITGSGTTNVTAGPPVGLAFQTQPSSAVAGASISPPVAVKVLDQFGNLVDSATDDVTVALGSNPGGGTLSGTLTVAAAGGVARFTNLSIDKVGSGYTLDASAAGLTGASSDGFDITSAAPAKLLLQTQPTDTVAGNAVNPGVQVAVYDRFDNLTDATVDVTVAIETNPSSGTLSGTTTVGTVAGVATFSDLWIDKVGVGYTLVLSSGSLTSVTTNEFAITPAAPYRLRITGQPSNAVAGAAIAPAIQVAAYDRFDNLATADATPVSLALGNNPSGATLMGTRILNTTDGVATFSDLAVNRAGAAYTLVAGSAGLFGATSVGFDITAAQPTQLAFIVQPSNSMLGRAIAPAVQVALQDASGNTVVDSTLNVTINVGTNPAGGTLSGTSSVDAVGGVATFSDLSLDTLGIGYTLEASAGGLTATSAAFDVTAGAAARLVFTVQPANAASSTTMSPVTVQIQDAAGNRTSTATAVTLAIGTNPAGGLLAGTTTVSSVDGEATFADLSIDKVGAGYTLVASAASLGSATSTAFDIGAGAVATYEIVGMPPSVTAGTEVTFDVVAKDAHGNVANDYAGTASITSSDSAAGLPGDQTFTSGVLSGVRVTLRSLGMMTVTVTDASQASLTASARTNVTAFPQPTVAVTAPAAGAEVSGQVTITAEGAVASGTTLAEIALLVDGAVVGTGSASPASATWDTSGLKGGSTHIITARITDGAGNVVHSSPVAVTIKGDDSGGGGGCGCGATGGADAAGALALLAVARQMLSWRRRRRQA